MFGFFLQIEYFNIEIRRSSDAKSVVKPIKLFSFRKNSKFFFVG